MDTKNLYKFIFIIVIVIFVGLVSYFVFERKPEVNHITQVTPVTQNKIANWKTYKSTKAKFMFKYPSDWSIAKEYKGKSENKSTSGIMKNFINIAKAQIITPQTITPPNGWETVSKGYYVTAAGVKANTYTVVLAPAGYKIRGDQLDMPSEPVIVINEQQFSCHGKEWWDPKKKTFKILAFVNSPNFKELPPFRKYKTLEGKEMTNGLNYIATCSKDPNVLDVLDKIAKTFVAIQPANK